MAKAKRSPPRRARIGKRRQGRRGKLRPPERVTVYNTSNRAWLADVRFSNRPRSSAFRLSTRFDVARGLVLLYGIGTKALVWGFLDHKNSGLSKTRSLLTVKGLGSAPPAIAVLSVREWHHEFGTRQRRATKVGRPGPRSSHQSLCAGDGTRISDGTYSYLKVLKASGNAWRPDHAAVCTENSFRVDHVSVSLNLRGDDRSLLPLPGPVRLAIQVERPT